MGPRFVFTALIVAFAVAVTFATLTTVRHVNGAQLIFDTSDNSRLSGSLRLRGKGTEVIKAWPSSS